MTINISEVIWTVICFFVLLLVLDRLLFKPINKIMDQRKAHIDSGLEEARLARAEQEEANKTIESQWKESSELARKKLAEAKLADESERSGLIAQARTETAAAAKTVREESAAQRARAEQEISDAAPELVSILTGKLLGSNAPEESELKALIENEVKA